MSSTVFSVQNTHLQKIQPDILEFGITTFVDQIQFAERRDPDTGEGKDTFQVQIDFYRDRYDEEFNAILRDGVEYDEDSSGSVSDSEKEPIHHLRLVR